MVSPKDIINNVFQGLEVSEEEKQQILGAYALAYYKKSFEILMEVKLTDQEFLNRMAEVFNNEVSKLPPKVKKIFDETLEKSKGDLISNLLSRITSKLDSKTQQRVKNNVAKITEIPVSTSV